ncbi:trypsin-like peptidase domain-containing protein [Streptomyces sp. NPDC001606]
MGGRIDYTARVAEILVQQGGDGDYGSGFLITKSLVLTAEHLLRKTDTGRPRTISVMLGGSAERLPADVAWRSKTQDLALLRLRDPLPGLPAVTFGCLPSGPGTVKVFGNGFPRHARREEIPGLPGRGNVEVHGVVRLGSNLKSGHLDIATTDAPVLTGPDPWKGMSGAAFFTAEERWLVGVQTHRQTPAGPGSLTAEPIARACEDDPEFAAVLKSDGVRVKPRNITGDTDPLAAVVDQDDLLAGLTGFKKNLISDHLPFVFPGTDHEADPRRIWDRILDGNDDGLLLVGQAGTGKTRTGIEVGRLAQEAGWRVLHVRPGGSPSLTEDIARAVQADSRDVLVVLDYLNLFLAEREGESPLDLEAVKGRLLPDAAREGISVVFLASVRPGWLQQHRARLRSFFGEVHLRQDEEFLRLVADQALHQLAPTAMADIGPERMRQLCGRRPILALLIACELERRARDRIPQPDLAGVREGTELARWLHARLREDALTVPAAKSSLDGVHASDELVAAAAAAAACPQARPAVLDAAATALAAQPGGAARAETVLTALVGLGWLEGDGDGHLEVAHDIVCDQLVESVILPDGMTVDQGRTYDLLSGCFTEPRTIGRYSTNLARQLNDLALRKRDTEVRDCLSDWFAANASTIGQVMQRDPDVGGYALGAICSGPPWAGPLVEHWQAIVDPWMEEYGGTVNARHVLRRGIKNLPVAAARRLVPTALQWLETYSRRREGGYVLSILLDREEVSTEFLAEVIQAAVQWLENNCQLAEAGVLLTRILARRDLTRQQEQRVFAAAGRWLVYHGGKREAAQVLGKLLEHPTLPQKDAHLAISRTGPWLREHGTLHEASHVLSKLLARDDLVPAVRRQTALRAGEWLDKNGLTPEASHVISPLVGQPGANPEETRKVLAWADDWLDLYGTRQDASHVLSKLLAREDLAGEELRSAVRRGILWTEEQPKESDWTYVLDVLLRRRDLTEAERDRAVRLADEWLDQHAADSAADFFIRVVIERPDLTPAETRRFVAHADHWLGLHALAHQADRLINSLLECHGLTPDERGMATGYAEQRLQGQPHDEDNSYALVRLLRQRDVSAQDAERHVAAALDWLAAHGDGSSASHVIGALLERQGLTADTVARASATALSWLDGHQSETGSSWVLAALLARTDLPAAAVPQTVAKAVRWLTGHGDEEGAGFVLQHLLNGWEMDGPQLRTVFGLSLGWIEQHQSDVLLSSRILGNLLFRHDLTEQEVEQAVSRALSWAREHLDTYRSERTVRALLRREDLNETDTRTAVELATVWGATHCEHHLAGLLLADLLGRPDITDEQLTITLEAASTWLEKNPGHVKLAAVHAAKVRAQGRSAAAGDSIADAVAHLRQSGDGLPSLDLVGALLSQKGLSQEEFDSLAALVLDRVDAHFTDPDSAHHLNRVLTRRRLAGAMHSRAVATAERWLGQQGDTPQARLVLRGLLMREDLSPAQAATALEHTERWMQRHALLHEAQFVLKTLLKRHMAPEEGRKTVRTALRWLELHGGTPQATDVLHRLNASRWPTAADLARLVGHSRDWVTDERSGHDVQLVLEPLLERSDLTPEQMETIAGCAVRWSATHLGEVSAPRLLKSLLARSDIPWHVAEPLAGLTHDQVRPDPTGFEICFYLDALLRVRTFPAERLGSVVGWSLQWLGLHMPHFKARLVLRSLLPLDLLAAEQLRAAEEHALRWLRENQEIILATSGQRPGREIVELLLARPDIGADTAAEARRFAAVFDQAA